MNTRPVRRIGVRLSARQPRCDLTRCVKKLDRRRSPTVDRQAQAWPSLAIGERDAGGPVCLFSDEDTPWALRRAGPGCRNRPVARGRFRDLPRRVQLVDQLAQPLIGTVPHLEPGPAFAVLLRVAEPDRLVLFQLVEHDASIGAALPALLLPTVGESSDLVAFIVEENQSRDRARTIEHL